MACISGGSKWAGGSCSSLGKIGLCNFTFDQMTETPTCPPPPPCIDSCLPAFHFRHNCYLYLHIGHMPGSWGGGGASHARSQPSTWGGGGLNLDGWNRLWLGQVDKKKQKKLRSWQTGAAPGFWKGGGAWGVGDRIAVRSSQVCAPGGSEGMPPRSFWNFRCIFLQFGAYFIQKLSKRDR